MRLTRLAALLLLPALANAASQKMYDFEDGLKGWTGKVAIAKKGASQGKQALEIDATGSNGWNQELAVQPACQDWGAGLELFMDVLVPPGASEASGFIEFIPVFTGPAAHWYPLAKVKLKDGLNKLSFELDGTKVGKPEKFHLVLNSGGTIPGKILVDNLRLRVPGKPGTLKVSVKDQAGKPVAGALVCLGKQAARSDARGQASLKMAADKYKGEVLGEGLAPTRFEAAVPEAKSKALTLKVQRRARPPAVPARAWAMGEEALRPFDAHKLYGQNMAMWNGLDPFTNADHLKKIREAGGWMIRVPGGGYGNHWDWKDGGIYKLDGSKALDWKPEADWAAWKKFLKDLGPQAEAMLILNTYNSTPQAMVEWVKDARDSGIIVRYVELSNEPDLDPNLHFQGEKGAATHVEKFVKGVVPFAKALRKAYPDLRILGPCTAQIVHRECPDKSPWDCDRTENEPWMKKFLRLYSEEGDLLDGISFHSYPYWPGTPPKWDAAKAFEATGLLREHLPQWRAWLKEYYPKKAAQMEIAMTEYHVQVAETASTVGLDSAVWHADFLAEFLRQGGDLASAWDLNTTKAAEGGGHGMLDPAGDPTRPYAERGKYWVYKMLASHFSGTLVQAKTGLAVLGAYAAKDGGRLSVLLVNRSPTTPLDLSLQVSGAGAAKQARLMRLSAKEYLWSEVLYRAVVNEDPTQASRVKEASLSAEQGGWRLLKAELEPMSVTLAILE